MNIVVISQNQSEWIEPMYECLPKEENHIVFVFDRCKDGSEYIAKYRDIPYIVNESGTGRKTSTCRNMGYRYLKETYGLDDTLFLDGDRIIVKGDFGNIVTNSSDISLLTLENDGRTRKIFDENYGGVFNNFFSCGLFIKKGPLLEIESFYKSRPEYGKSLVFPENVEIEWGIEDTHLGDICYHIGLSAELADGIKLRGCFGRSFVNSLDTIETRFRLREKLNVKW